MGKLYIRVVTNSLAYDVGPAIDALAKYVLRHTPFVPVFSRSTVSLLLAFKDFGIMLQGGDVPPAPSTTWGLDGIKAQLRALGPVPRDALHIVIFVYELPQGFAHQLGAWTYPNDLNGAAFVETPCIENWAANGNLFRILSHELIHALHRLCWWDGVATNDTMDMYDGEFDVEAPNGNRARNLRALEPHWDTVIDYLNRKWLNLIQEKLVALLQTFNLMPESKLDLWAEAIKSYEGWYKPGQVLDFPEGSRSWRNKNPGNLKYTRYVRTYLGAISEDRSGFSDPNTPGFAIFPSEAAGDKALRQFLSDAANRQLLPFHKFDPNIPYHKVLLPHGQKGDELPELTLNDFFHIYAPVGDGKNEPSAYTLFVSGKIGCDPQTFIKTLV